jgi:enoyl-CoA hydratase/carnithine racemase
MDTCYLGLYIDRYFSIAWACDLTLLSARSNAFSSHTGLGLSPGIVREWQHAFVRQSS